MFRIFRFAAVAATWVVMLGLASTASAADPLPSWNDGASKQAIVKFVESVTREGSPDFVPAPERIATFDNDGTLWAEQPIYFQVMFMADRVKALAPKPSGVENQGTVRVTAERQPGGPHRRRRSRRRGTDRRHAFRDDDG